MTRTSQPQANRMIENDLYSLTFGASGTLDSVTNKMTQTTLPVHQDFHYYEACGVLGQTAGPMNAGSACHGGGASGPYMFRPDANKTAKDGQNIPLVRSDKLVSLTITHTAAGAEVRQEFAPWLTQVIRLPTGTGSPELEMSIGPVPIDDGVVR